MFVDTKELFDGLTAIASIGAVLFAACSSWLSYRATKAAEASVAQTKANWHAQRSPVLICDVNFDSFSISMGGDFQFLMISSAKESRDNSYVPVLTVTNYGESPALDLQLVFELEGDVKEISLPETVAGCAVRINRDMMDDETPVLDFIDLNQYEVLSSHSTFYLPSCAPGQKRTVPFPIDVVPLIWVRAVEAEYLTGMFISLKLTLKIVALTLEREKVIRIWDFQIKPWCLYHDRDQMEVLCSVRLLPSQ